MAGMKATKLEASGARHQVLLVDDHPIVRRGMAQLISHEADLCVSGEASDSDEALSLLQKNPPDVLVVDISLRKTSGILNKKLDELELYRVKDSTLEQPLLLRMFGLGNITIMSSDVSLPVLQLSAVPGAYEAREKLRLAVEAERDRKRVRDINLSDGDGDVLAS